MNGSPEQPASSHMRERLLLFSIILAWAISWPVIKLGVIGFAPGWYACLRYAIAACCLFGFLAVRGGLRVPSRADWPVVIVSGVLQMGVYSLLTAFALRVLPPGRASVLAFSTPIWVVPLAAGWLGERISVRAAVGVGSGCLGIIVIAAPSLNPAGHGQLAAYGMLLGAAASWAVALVFVRGHRFAGTTLALAPWQMALAALLSLPVAGILEGPLPAIDPRVALSLAYVGPFATAFAYWAVVEAGRLYSPSTLSMGLLAAPCLGLAISAAVFHERIDFALVAGIALIGAGIRLTTRRPGHRSGVPLPNGAAR